MGVTTSRGRGRHAPGGAATGLDPCRRLCDRSGGTGRTSRRAVPSFFEDHHPDRPTRRMLTIATFANVEVTRNTLAAHPSAGHARRRALGLVVAPSTAAAANAHLRGNPGHALAAAGDRRCSTASWRLVAATRPGAPASAARSRACRTRSVGPRPMTSMVARSCRALARRKADPDSSAAASVVVNHRSATVSSGNRQAAIRNGGWGFGVFVVGCTARPAVSAGARCSEVRAATLLVAATRGTWWDTGRPMRTTGRSGWDRRSGALRTRR